VINLERTRTNKTQQEHYESIDFCRVNLVWSPGIHSTYSTSKIIGDYLSKDTCYEDSSFFSQKYEPNGAKMPFREVLQNPPKICTGVPEPDNFQNLNSSCPQVHIW